MKTYAQINEAISAARLAQLKAKGKGDAAAAQMKADNLSSSKVSSTATSSARKALPSGETKGGALGGGALAKRSSQGTSITKRDTGKSGGLVKKTFGKPVKSSGSSELANTGVKKVNVKVDKPRPERPRPERPRPERPGPERPGTTRSTKDSDDGDWGKDIPDWKGDSGSKLKAKKKKDDNKPKLPKIKDPRSDVGGSLGRGEGDLSGKDKENSQI